MNYKKFIQLTKDYLDEHADTYARGDLHITPRIEQEDLLHYIRKFYGSFPRSRYVRFISRLKQNRLVVEMTDKFLTFDPVFVH